MGYVPITSSKGNQYVTIIDEYESKHIHGEPIKNFNAADLTQSYEKFHFIFTSQGLQPKLHILDN